MKVWVLTENTTCREDLAAEHGLSLYIETPTHKILFDAGQSGAFADNAQKLGIDLSAVDFAVLSHGHYDHGGGLARFLQINKKAKVYVNQYAFGHHCNANGKYIGLDQSLQCSERLVYLEDSMTLAPGIRLHSCRHDPQHYPADSAGMTVLKDGKKCPEDFRHEQYLLLTQNGQSVLISGCSHRGILNIVRWFQPDVLIGGFHFMRVEDEEQLKAAARILLSYKTVYYTGHCTGQKQFACLKNLMGQQLQPISTGSCLEICAKK